MISCGSGLMKVGVCTGRNAPDVASEVVEELGDASFAIFFTTEVLSEEDIEEVREVIRCPFIGCYTEGVIHDGKIVEGTGVLALKGVKAATELSNSPTRIGEKLGRVKEGTAILFLNWMTRKISSFLRSVYNQLGFNFSYTGGCSGILGGGFAFQFSEKGMSENMTCAASLNVRMSVAFDHGWEVLCGPYIITKYKDDRIYELDGKCAFEVYCKATRCQKENFEECRKEYPFGFLCACGKYMLRAPLEYFKDGSMRLMSEVPYSSVTLIMGCKEEEDVINAAENAARSALMQHRKGKFALVFDCVSRKELLGSRFSEELERLNEVIEIPYLGMLSVGEIVSSQKVCTPSFHNKSVVVAVGGE